MKALRSLFFLLAATAFCGATDSPPNTRVAVLDFQAEDGVGKRLGVGNAGESIAHLLTVDISGLAPLAVVDRGSVRRSLGGKEISLVSPISPGDAREIGRSLSASTIVDGRIFEAGAEIIIAARVVSPETGQTLGTMVKGDTSKPIADLISQLSIQVGRIALAQRGVEPGLWEAAAIVGTRKCGSFLTHDEVACVMDIDGRHIPDETDQWDHKQPLLPGLHEIFVRYHDGNSTAGHSFVLDAKPGVSYEVRYELQPSRNPRLWIEDLGSHTPATAMITARMGDTPFLSGSFMGWGPYGVWSEETGNPDFVRPPGQHSK